MNTSPSALDQAPSPSFAFVQALAAELNSGDLDLPSFPDIAIRVRKVLEDDNSTIEDIVRVLGSEPGLAARLVKIANSAAYSRGA